MSCHNFETLVEHVGHKVEVVTYGDPPVNVAVECVDCGTVLFSFDYIPADDYDQPTTI
jgi:hypothetical protein